MFQGRCLSSEIGGQGQKNVTCGTVSPHFTKLFLILYGLVKITSGCYTLESVPEKKIVEIRTVYAPEFNQTQCYNMPSGHQFALKSYWPLSLKKTTGNYCGPSSRTSYYSHLRENFSDTERCYSSFLRQTQFSRHRLNQLPFKSSTKHSHMCN